MPEDISEVESKARKMGWVPQEDFKGDPERWVDADKFLERGENVLPILRERLDKAYDKITSMETEVREVKKAAANIAEYNSKVEKVAYERATKEYEAQLKSIKSEMKKAVKDGDEDTYTELESKLDSLEPPEKPEEPTKEPEIPDWLEGWVDDNQWFKTDPELQMIARAYDENAKWEPDLKGKARADAVAKKIKELYPQKFTNPKRETPSVVDAGGDGEEPPDPKKKTFNDLPAEAKAAYKELKADFKRMNKEFTKEQYLANYEWEKD